ncbi:polysaccharide biosynthesis protein [Pleomorphovibrio marinus]|uniref:polysaccharide biosynthesis protein n=1 Tax=Pleomorphovibrio marinus TaxID=2164132 RepID=UPI000E0CB3CD|nr:nucleoside-diphosphate sugar epimerase/dehydratase [Pleomorphovibrio marinus]
MEALTEKLSRAKRLNVLPRWIIVSLDAFILFSASSLAFFIVFNFEFSKMQEFEVWRAVLIFTIFGLGVMFFTKSYEGIVRHTGMRDGVLLGKTIFFLASGISLTNILLFNVFMQPYVMPFSVLLVAAIFSSVILILYRLLVRDLFYRIRNINQGKKVEKRVAIYGAGEAGILTHKALIKDNQIKYTNCGFLDDAQDKKGKFIEGVKVFGDLEELSQLVKEQQPDELIISILEICQERKREIIERAIELDIQVFTIPPVNQWVSGVLQPNAIREVNIEDLLGRKSISLKNNRVTSELKSSVVLVSGAAGSIGSELSMQIARADPQKIILLDKSESALYDIEHQLRRMRVSAKIEVILADVKDKEGIDNFFRIYRPDFVFHAAAYKHVPMLEKYPKEAIRCNVIGTKNMADAALKYNVKKFVFVSTDKAVNPTNVMGASKRLAEMYVQALNQYLDSGDTNQHTKYITTRFGNVLGSNGSVIPLFREQIMLGGPVTVTDPNITRYFMTIPEACELVLEAGVMGNGGEIYVFDMGKPIKILDLAKKMIHLSGKKPGVDIEIEFSGLREGEKLFEELLNDTESVLPTHHEKIKIAQVASGSYQNISSCINLCQTLAEEGSDWDLVAYLKQLVPEYISHVSRFEALDHLESEK